MIFIAVLISCKSVAVLPSKRPIKDIQVKDLTKAISKAGLHFDKFRSRVKTTYDDGKRSQQLIINLRMVRNKSIWMSANMLVPIAKILISPKKVLFYEKFQKTFFDGDINFINKQFNTNFDFIDLQDLLIGLPISDFNKGHWETISHPKYYILSPRSKKSEFKPTFFFDTEDFILKEQRFLVPGTSQSLTVKYAAHQRLEGQMIPLRIEISIFNGVNLTRITLEFTRTDFPDQMSIPFDIPPGYKSIEF